MGAIEYLVAVAVTAMFAWWPLYLAYRTGVLLIMRPPYIAIRGANPFMFWFVAFVYVPLIAMSLFMLFMLVVTPFIH